METTDKPTDGAGTIPGRRSEGIAGPSREVSQRDGAASPKDKNEPENSELAWAKRHIKEPVTVERKTELAGCGLPVAQGVFQATMSVALINEGPVTMLLDSRKEF